MCALNRRLLYGKHYIQAISLVLFFSAFCFAETPLPSQFYSAAPHRYDSMTFVIPEAIMLRQATLTISLAVKRQQAGIETVILFTGTAATLPIVHGLPFNKITSYSPQRTDRVYQPMPICPQQNRIKRKPVVPDVIFPKDNEIYLPRLKKLLQEHAALGGKIVLCPCCDGTLKTRIQFLPKEIAPSKLRRLKKQLEIKEGQY